MKPRFLILTGILIVLSTGILSAIPQTKEVYILDFENKTGNPALDWLENELSGMIFQDQLRLPGLTLHPEYSLAEVLAFNEQDARIQNKNQYVLLGSVYPSSAGGDVLIHMSSIHLNTWQNRGEKSFTAHLSDRRALKDQLIIHLGKLFNIEPLSLDFTVRVPQSDEGRVDTRALTEARRELEALTKSLGRTQDQEPSSLQKADKIRTPGMTVLHFDHTESSARLEMDRSHIARTRKAFYELLLNPYLVQINEPTLSTLPYRPNRGRIRIEVSYEILPELLDELTDVLPFRQVSTGYNNYTTFIYQADFSDIPFQLQRDIQLGNYRTIPVIQLADRQGQIIHTFIDGQYLDTREIEPSDNVTIQNNFQQLLVMTSSRTDIQLYLKKFPAIGIYELELPVSTLENLSEIRVQLMPITELYDRF